MTTRLLLFRRSSQIRPRPNFAVLLTSGGRWACSGAVAHLFSVKSLIKHCPEKLSTILKLLLGVTVILTVALWIRSCSFRDSIYFSTPTWGGVVSSTAGKLVHGGAIWTRPQGWSLEIQSIVCPDMDRLEPVFRLHIDRSGWEMSVPHWLLVLVFGLPLLVHHMFQVRQQGKAGTHSPNKSGATTAPQPPKPRSSFAPTLPSCSPASTGGCRVGRSCESVAASRDVACSTESLSVLLAACGARFP